ncbi:MAG: FliG C-terminal domain-containing protein [Pirellulaceae bacterium]|nr:hypothetical protein [Planctomycetales bacterium]
MANTLRQVAILLSSVDKEDAEAILGALPPDDAMDVRRLIDEIGTVDSMEQEDVIRRFLSADGRVGHAHHYEHEKIERPSDEPPRQLTVDGSTDEAEQNLRSYAARVAEILRNEQPQTIAVALSRQSAQLAAKVVELLPAEYQVDVLCRMATLTHKHGELGKLIEEEIHRLLMASSETPRHHEGWTAVRAVIDSSSSPMREEWLQLLNQHEGDQRHASTHPASHIGSGSHRRAATTLSKSGARHARVSAVPSDDRHHSDLRHSSEGERRVHSPTTARVPEDTPSAPVLFTEIIDLSDHDLQQVFTCVDFQVALLSLAGMNDHVANGVLSRLPAALSRRLRSGLSCLSPIRLRDIEHAKADLARVATELRNAKRIAIHVSSPRLILSA